MHCLECKGLEREAANHLPKLEEWTTIPSSPDLPPWSFVIQDLKLVYWSRKAKGGKMLFDLMSYLTGWTTMLENPCLWCLCAGGPVTAKHRYFQDSLMPCVPSFLLVAEQIAQLLLCGHPGLWIGKDSFLLYFSFQRGRETAVSMLVSDV